MDLYQWTTRNGLHGNGQKINIMKLFSVLLLEAVPKTDWSKIPAGNIRVDKLIQAARHNPDKRWLKNMLTNTTKDMLLHKDVDNAIKLIKSKLQIIQTDDTIELEKEADKIEAEVDSNFVTFTRKKQSPQVFAKDDIAASEKDRLISSEKRLYLYVAEKLTRVDKDGNCNLAELGQTTVYAGKDPVEKCLKRIKAGVGKDVDFDEGNINPIAVWDVSEQYKKFYSFGNPNQACMKKFDDDIREKIGHIYSKEWHNLSGIELKTEVNNELAKLEKTDFDELAPSIWQLDAAQEALDAINGKNKVRNIVAELCTRFGKTTWAGILSKEINNGKGVPLTVIGAYWTSALSSFKDDFSQFKQLRNNTVIVDTQKSGWEETIHAALNSKPPMQVVALLSLNNDLSGHRDERIRKLMGTEFTGQQKLIFIDESDYGAHTIKQVTPMKIQRRKNPNDIYILATGTNSDRALGKGEGGWGEVMRGPTFHAMKTNYWELVYNKYHPTRTRNAVSTLKHFLEINKKRTSTVVPLYTYQMDLDPLVQNLKKLRISGEFVDVPLEEYPSWTKFSDNPEGARDFWMCLLREIFMGNQIQTGKHAIKRSMLLDRDVRSIYNRKHQLKKSEDETQKEDAFKPTVSMIWLPSQMISNPKKGQDKNTTPFHQACKMASEALGDDYVIIPVSGQEFTNRNVTQGIKNRIKEIRKNSETKNKDIIMISTGHVGSRSFTVPELTDSFICKDGGELGPLLQQVGRNLSPDGTTKKQARVWNLCFRPPSEERFSPIGRTMDPRFLEQTVSSAMDIAKKTGENIINVMDKFYPTTNLFWATPGREPPLRMSKESVIAEMQGNYSHLGRVMASTFDLNRVVDNTHWKGISNILQDVKVRDRIQLDTDMEVETGKSLKRAVTRAMSASKINPDDQKVMNLRQLIAGFPRRLGEFTNAISTKNGGKKIKIEDALTQVRQNPKLAAEYSRRWFWGIPFNKICDTLDPEKSGIDKVTLDLLHNIIEPKESKK